MKLKITLIFLVVLTVADAATPSRGFSYNNGLMFKRSEIFLNASSTVFHMEIDLYKNDGSILFTAFSKLKTATQARAISTVASGFSLIADFRQINSTHVAVADANTYCLMLVNRVDRSVRILAGNYRKRGYQDGNPGSFDRPWSVEIDIRNPGKLLVLERDRYALRSVDIDSGTISTIIKTMFNTPQGMSWDNGRLLVANYYYISEVAWSGNKSVTNKILAGSASTRGDTDSSFKSSKFYQSTDIERIADKLFIVSESGNNKLRLLDTDRQQVYPICIPAPNQIFCTSGSTIRINYANAILKTSDAVYVGTSTQIFKFTGGDLFRSTSASTSTSSPLQPSASCRARDITIGLKAGESKANVEVVAGKWLQLGVGTHKYTEVSFGRNCTISITIAGSVNPRCPGPITAAVSSKTQTASVEVPSQGKKYKLELPIGKATLRVPYDSGMCDVVINVVDAVAIRRRITFQAIYDVKCNQAEEAVTKNIILATAQQHFIQIKELCGEHCSPIVSKQPIIDCNDGRLRIQWPTDPVYSSDVVAIKANVKSALRQKVVSRGVASLTLIVPSKIPPVVYPIQNSDGDSVTFSLTSFCDGNFTYNPQTGKCQ